MVSLLRDRVLQFLAEYGERGYVVLKAAVEAARSRGEGFRLGDFSYRDVVARLKAAGVSYNPSMLLRILERDYGIIETTYKSSSQHWWKFTDLGAVEEALRLYEQDSSMQVEYEDPEVELVRIQVAALDVGKLIETLKTLDAKPRLTSRDRALFASIAFGKLEVVVRLLKKIEELGLEYELKREREILEEVLRLASRVARRMMQLESRMGSEQLRSTGQELGRPSNPLKSALCDFVSGEDEVKSVR